MQAYVYVDGFNPLLSRLEGHWLKWLNLSQLATRVLDPADTVAKVRYFTARVSARSGDPDAPRRQQIFFNALKTVPNLDFHYGRFLPKKKMRPLVSTGRFVEIHDTEEKGSDVNLATHLLNDGWHKRNHMALVLSHDTDHVEPIRIVAQELRLKVRSSGISAKPIWRPLNFQIPSSSATEQNSTSREDGSSFQTATCPRDSGQVGPIQCRAAAPRRTP
jgi:hypothetical protein